VTSLPTEIFRHWTHSHEEDTEEARVYRPDEFEFPPARGRRGLELQSDGEFVRYDIAPADGIDELAGRWEAEGSERVRVALPDREPYTLTILSVDADVLRIARAS